MLTDNRRKDWRTTLCLGTWPQAVPKNGNLIKKAFAILTSMASLGNLALTHLAARVPGAVVTYAVLGLLDFGFTLMSFQIGLKEANPVLAWYAERGLFEVAKIASTIVVILLGFFLWRILAVRSIIYGANLIMTGVLVYHIANWARLLLVTQ